MAVCVVSAIWGGSVAITARSSEQKPSVKTTKAKVYSSAQATRGEALYNGVCVSCHPPATYTGAVFLRWQGRHLGDLMEFLQEKMPKNDPGSLTAEEYADVIAFLLKLNKMPVGRTALPADTKALKGITIDIRP